MISVQCTRCKQWAFSSSVSLNVHEMDWYTDTVIVYKYACSNCLAIINTRNDTYNTLVPYFRAHPDRHKRMQEEYQKNTISGKQV